MENKKKLLLQILFLLFVAGFTAWSIFRGKDLHTIIHFIKKADPLYVLLSILCVLVFIWGESIIIYFMLKTWGVHIPAKRCYLYSGVGFFFSCITPSATGGQPAQIYFMKKDKIPIPVSTVILMAVTITYKFVLVVIGILVLTIRPAGIMMRLKPVLFWCYLGVALNIFCVTFMSFLLLLPNLAKKILFFFMDVLEKIHLMKKKQKRRVKLENAMELYKETADFLVNHKLLVFNSFVITIVQRLALFFITGLTYLAFGFRGESLFDLMILQGMISVAVDMLPLPGGMGISEKLFLMIFIPIFGHELTLPAMLVSRGISYYGQLIISAIISAYAGIRLGRNREVQEK